MWYLYLLKLQEVKDQWTQCWGAIDFGRGNLRTMVQNHELLLINKERLSPEEVIEQLSNSRDIAKRNLREWMNEYINDKNIKPGEKTGFCIAEKDIWEFALRITKEKKRLAIQSLMTSSTLFPYVQGNQPSASTISAIVDYIPAMFTQMDSPVNPLIQTEEDAFLGSPVKLLT